MADFLQHLWQKVVSGVPFAMLFHSLCTYISSQCDIPIYVEVGFKRHFRERGGDWNYRDRVKSDALGSL